jgi:basic amino acid/polyamine antiporter, APA family
MSDSPSARLHRHVGFRTATALVVANVIGAGIFTTTGFQAADLGNPLTIFALWAIGGLLAYCGALCYAELGAEMPDAGGEYAYLRRSYGQGFGFMSAFVSLIAGFAAPIAAALKSVMIYLQAFLPVLQETGKIAGLISLSDLCALVLVWLLVAAQMGRAGRGFRFINYLTAFKVAGIIAIIIAAAIVGNGDLTNFSYSSASYLELSPDAKLAAIGTSLIFVMFCYSGWNAAAYIGEEIMDPQRNLPLALLAGTVIVTLLYLALNAVYLYGANVDGLAGHVEVGLIAGQALFGEFGAQLVTIVLVVSLLASASAMTVAGPRVYFALGRDVRLFQFLGKSTDDGVPLNALILQATVASIIIVTGRVDQILQYAGFTLALMSALAVSCVIVLRYRFPDLVRPFRLPVYPLPPVVYILVSLWTMYWALQGRPFESTLALATVAAGGLIFYIGKVRRRITG